MTYCYTAHTGCAGLLVSPPPHCLLAFCKLYRTGKCFLTLTILTRTKIKKKTNNTLPHSLWFSRIPTRRHPSGGPDLPVGHTGLVQRHEVDLTRRTTFGTAEEHLVVALAQELEALGLLVHKHSVQVAGLDRTDLQEPTD